MSWKDEEIDKLFQENANGGSFEYKNEYWKEFEAAALPVAEKGKDFLWIATALLFLGLVTVTTVLKQDGVTTPNNGTALTAELTKADNENTQVDVLNSSDANTETGGQGMNASENASFAYTNYSNSNSNSKLNANANNGSRSATPDSQKTGANGNNGMPRRALTQFEIDQVTMTQQRIEANLNFTLGNPFESDGLNPMNRFENSETPETFVDQLALRSIENEILTEKMPDLIGLPNSLVPVTSLYFELNGGLSESIVSPSDSYSNSFGAGFGVRMQNGNLSFTAGVNGIVSNHKDIQLSREAIKIYGFGSSMHSVHLNYRQIYTIEANFSMGWSRGKHTLTAGIRPSYVVGSKVQDRTEVDNVVVRDEVVYGYLEGLSRFGLKPQIGYSYSFTHGWTVGGNISVQTQQALNASFINGENNRFPIDGQIYLRKAIRLRR